MLTEQSDRMSACEKRQRTRTQCSRGTTTMRLHETTAAQTHRCDGVTSCPCLLWLLGTGCHPSIHRCQSASDSKSHLREAFRSRSSIYDAIVHRRQRLVQQKSNIEVLFISVYVYKSKINAAKKQWLLACKEKKKKSNKKGEKRKLQKTPLGFFSTFQSYMQKQTLLIISHKTKSKQKITH